MGYDTGGGGGVIYTCPHTGEKFMGVDLAGAHAMALSCSPNCDGALSSGNLSVLTGQPSDQIGSQVWMNANPEGKMPDLSLAEKMALSDNGSAEYAAGWLGTYIGSIPGNVSINPNIGIIQKYPVSQGTAELWKAVPQLAPPTFDQVNGKLIAGGVSYATPVTRPGGEAEPEYATRALTDGLLNTGDTIGTANRAGVGTTGVGEVSGIQDTIKNIPFTLIAIIGVGLLLLYMMGKGLSGRATA